LDSSLRLCAFAFFFFFFFFFFLVLAPRLLRLQIDVEERRLAYAGDVARLGHGEIDAVDWGALAPSRSCLVF
jgi:hypothetical protein